jgi:hypothetical protein
MNDPLLDTTDSWLFPLCLILAVAGVTAGLLL